MKLQEINTYKHLMYNVTPEVQARAEKEFKRLMVDITKFAPGPFKSIDGGPFYLEAASPEKGYMEINLMDPDTRGSDPYVYVKWNRVSEDDAKEFGLYLRSQGWKLKTTQHVSKSAGIMLQADIYLF